MDWDSEMRSNQYSSEPIPSPPASDRVDSLLPEWSLLFLPLQPPLFVNFFPFFSLSFWSLIVVIFHAFYHLITSIKHLFPVSYFLLQIVRFSSCESSAIPQGFDYFLYVRDCVTYISVVTLRAWTLEPNGLGSYPFSPAYYIWSWTSHLTSSCLSFLICKMGY